MATNLVVGDIIVGNVGASKYTVPTTGTFWTVWTILPPVTIDFMNDLGLPDQRVEDRIEITNGWVVNPVYFDKVDLVDVTPETYEDILGTLASNQLPRLLSGTLQIRERDLVIADNSSNITALGDSRVIARGNVAVTAYTRATIEAWGTTTVNLYNNASAVAKQNSRIFAFDFSSAAVRDNSILLLQSPFVGYDIFDNAVVVKTKAYVPEGGKTMYKRLRDNRIAELFFEEGTPYQARYGVKHRFGDKALVVSITDAANPSVSYPTGVGYYSLPYESSDNPGGPLIYITNQYVISQNGYDDALIECAAGIHCFNTREQAVAFEFPQL